jgi:uncharacterized protein YjbI with pentapeptide repeats
MAKKTSNKISKSKPSKSKKKPEAPSWLLENIAEASRNARTIYFLFIGFLVYCGLTVVGITDRQIILNDAVSLPIIKMDVPLNGFFILAPVIVIFLFLYFQLYLIIRKKLITNLKTNYTYIEEERLYPWMLLALDYPKKGVIGWIQSAVVKFSVWYSVPIVLLLISTWFVKKHAPILSYIIGLTPIIGTFIVLYFWFQYENVKVKKRQILKHIKNNLAKSILIFIVIIYEIFFLSFIIPNANDGFSTFYAKTLIESFFSIDLSYQKLITEPENDYSEIYWLDLSGAHLEGANLKSTVLKRADLRGAHLQRTYMDYAILQEANLQKANLKSASLRKANLQEAFLYYANLQEVNLGWANLQEANLTGANLQKANLLRAQLQGTWLYGGELHEAILVDANLQGAHLEEAKLNLAFLIDANLQEADLRWASLQGAVLIRANLQEADLEGADFREAQNLSVSMLKTANNWILAFYDDDILSNLGLPSNHNERLTNKDFSGYNFAEANLQGANLANANLDGAELQEADMRGAKNLTVDQLSMVKTLYGAKLDPHLLKEIKEKYPHLLEEPVWLIEKELIWGKF